MLGFQEIPAKKGQHGFQALEARLIRLRKMSHSKVIGGLGICRG